MRFCTFVLTVVVTLVGVPACRVSPIPRNIDAYYAKTQSAYPLLNGVLQEGDVIFRKGHARILNDMVDWSNTTATWCESPFSHVGLVLERHGDTFIIVDAGPYGIERKFLVDWLIQGPENLVVKRLLPEYQPRIPQVLAVARALVERDVLYDDKYLAGDSRFYCTEIVDYCFREAGIPLADKVAIGRLPGLRGWHKAGAVWTLSHLTHIRTDQPVVIAGNAHQGLFSSELLAEVPFDSPEAPPTPYPSEEHVHHPVKVANVGR